MALEIKALVVKQWLPEWNGVKFSHSEAEYRAKPKPQFYVFSMPAPLLLRLSGIARRTADSPRASDLGIQRRHDPERSREIARYVRHGYPWSTLGIKDQELKRFVDLMMPGWLPTAVVANILPDGSERYGARVSRQDLIQVTQDGESQAKLLLPEDSTSANWRPTGVPPIEIIDGQHRLWAFEEEELRQVASSYELPVVAFHGLDITWQAYLFWTINIKPKRINASLAFDLYPLLRTQEWLEAVEGPRVYREARAQQLSEALWAHPASPWHGRINMLGEPGAGDVTQAAFIRSLLASYVKRWEGRRVSIGGLFGGEVQGGPGVLPWSSAQQAAFLIKVWNELQRAIENCTEPWAQELRKEKSEQPLFSSNGRSDPAFYGRYSLLATDQGVRGVLQVTNDLCYVQADSLRLFDWYEDPAQATDQEAVSQALDDLEEMHELRDFLQATSEGLVRFDWRTSAAPGMADRQRRIQMAYRGSGGYREIRRQLLITLTNSPIPDVASSASEVMELLGYHR